MFNTIISFRGFFSNLTWARIKDLRAQVSPPPPKLTDANLTRQDGRVFIVTGGNSGIGLALIKMLYPFGGTIYMASRSEEKAKAAIKEVYAEYKAVNEGQAASSSKVATIKYMHLDLADLTTIKPSADFFKSHESRLDILWNNAGVAAMPLGSQTAQGLDVHIGTNCVAPLAFTEQLLPVIRKTAAESPADATRVIWTSSLSLDKMAPPGGVDLAYVERMCRQKTGSQDAAMDYAQSKAGNWYLADEGAKRWGHETSPGAKDGIVSCTLNPGQVATAIWRWQPWWLMFFIRLLFVPPRTGAYTMLFAGFSDELGTKEGKNGRYVFPFGRLKRGPDSRTDIVQAIKDGRAGDFWTWCERIAEPYVAST